MSGEQQPSVADGVPSGRFVLYGSPHSIPTYKVALMLRLCRASFFFRYVSFQKGMHRQPEFLAMSRWGQVPVLRDGAAVLVQSAAIVEYLADSLKQFRGTDADQRRAAREWAYWDADVLFPPIFACYGVYLGQNGLLPIHVEPQIAAYHRQKAEAALSKLEVHASPRHYLCGSEPTLADVLCFANLPFAEICGFDLSRWPAVMTWAANVSKLPEFRLPFDLLAMKDVACV
jgi:glutathione S-transferase